MPKPTGTVYVVELRAPSGDATPHLRLRAALKNLGRAFGLKCLSVVEKPPAPAAGEDESGAAKTNP